MKLTKFGKALLMSALSVGAVLSITSCVESYTVGYLYVTGTETPQTNGSGYIAGFKIDHNTGKLTAINGLNPPISTGGANPVRAVLLTGDRFVYILNRGVNKEGNGDCTSSDPCLNPSITQFAIGANGILTAQPETFYTQGMNPFRMIADGSGTYIYVLDHDSVYNGAVSSATNPNPNCANALTGSTTCGDITAFKIDSTTGRLQLVVNAQVTAAGGGAALPYFPVPSNPVDFVLSGGNLLTLSGTTAAASYPYTGGSTVFPYSYSSSNGQLTVNQNNAQALNIAEGTAIVGGGSYIWVLDNEPISVSGVTASQSQILPYTIGSGGSLSAATSGPIPDDATQSNPIYLVVESKGKWFYVANEGNNVIGTGTAESGLAGYYLESPFEPQEIPGEPIGFGSGPGPQCLVEDPSNQFIYTANANSSTVTGQVIDENAGVLTQFAKAPASYALAGPPTWCLVDGRTN